VGVEPDFIQSLADLVRRASAGGRVGECPPHQVGCGGARVTA
jgi:hypothetical protein